MRENFLYIMFEFNGILTKKPVFDKKNSENVFYIAISSFTPDHSHRTQNAFFKFLM